MEHYESDMLIVEAVKTRDHLGDLPGKGTDKADEAVQIGGTGPGDQRAQQDDPGSEDVLLPLDLGIVFA